MKTTTDIFDYYTRKLLATVPNRDFNSWCSANGYLPHHITSRGWAVIK